MYRCAVEFEALGKEYEQVYYHSDQLLKSLYIPYLREWHAAVGRRRVLVRLDQGITLVHFSA